MKEKNVDPVVITAGSAYLDIDAYACSMAMQELLERMGIRAIAYSKAVCNYSICKSLMEESPIADELPTEFDSASARYIIVDVSDPEFIQNAVPLDRIAAVYDHHTGFENYWQGRIGENARIEFIGAAATLVYREWKKCGLQEKMRPSTARLLLAAILDNTLDLTSQNTTQEDVRAFEELCLLGKAERAWCDAYFMEVQTAVEADLRIAMLNDIKKIRETEILPSRIAQLCVWDSERILERLPEIRRWFEEIKDGWMINLIDIKRRCSYFVCEDDHDQKKIQAVFGVEFSGCIAKTAVAYLRKEIIKKACYNK